MGKKKAEAREENHKLLRELAEIIEQGPSSGRMPLFLYGAYGTPIVIHQYAHAKRAIELYEEGGGKYEGTPLEEAERYPTKPPPRPFQAKFFGDLKKIADGNVWKNFCESFLTDWVVKFLYYYNQNEFPQEVENIYGILKRFFPSKNEIPNAIVMTTNFDGAIPEYIKKLGLKSQDVKAKPSPWPCLVLEDPKHITSTGMMGGEKNQVKPKPYIITLRGDVYHALCRNPLCSMGNKTVMAYEALEQAIRENPIEETGVWDKLKINDKVADFFTITTKNTADTVLSKAMITTLHSLEQEQVVDDPDFAKLVGKIVTRIMTCPECGTDRTLTISFPGLEIKEQEIANLMASVWQSLGSRISAICTIGFSGNSDREIVNHLARFAKQQKCRWFDFGKDDPTITKDLQSVLQGETAVRETGERLLIGDRAENNKKKCLFVLVDTAGGAQETLPILNSLIKDDKIRKDKNEKSKKEEVRADLLWIAHTGSNVERKGYSQTKTDKKPINICFKKDFPPDIKNFIASLETPNDQMVDMLNTSQLAMKDYWWNPGQSKCQDHDPGQHSRMHHSLGVLRIADAWFEVCRKSIQEKTMLHLNYLRHILNIATIFHDTGHIPFSHLTEETFRELHWSIDGAPYNHESLSIIRMFSILQEDEIENLEFLQNILNGQTGVNWLDAIMNSPFDSDKIDYVFRDQCWIGLSKRQEDHYKWFVEFVSDQEITDHGQIFLHGKSAAAAYRLLADRAYLYDTLYFAPKVRVMERIVRHILVTYFVLNVSDTVVSGLLKQAKAESSKKVLSLGSLIDKWPEQKDFTFTTKRAKQILSDLSSFKNNKLDVSDFGPAKVAYAIATLYEMIDTKFSKSSPYATPQQYRNGNNTGNVKSFIRFLEESLKNIPPISELHIIAEIGAWANEEAMRDNKDNKEHYLMLADACHLVLDPYRLTEEKDESAVNDGKWLDRVFADHCIAGPFIVRAPEHMKNAYEAEKWLKTNKARIEEIGRQLSYEYPSRVLLDVTGPFKILAYPDARVMHASDGTPFVCEQFWVPQGDPVSWAGTAKASVPLCEVDFRKSLPQAYKMRILIIDPTDREDSREVIVDRFKRACKIHKIPIEEDKT